MSEGKFIVLEGPDGSGKSTQARLLVEALKGRGLSVDHLRDPGGTEAGEAIRRILLDGKALARETELHLFLAARAQLVAERIRPALDAGRVVVCERFVASTFCYQVYPFETEGNLRDRFAMIATSALGLVPDRTLVLDVDPPAGLARKDGPLDRIERRDPAFHGRVRDGFRWLAKADLIRNLVWIPPGPVEGTQSRILRSVLDAR